MPTQHTLVPVGMMGVQTNTANLQSDLKNIYEGNTNSQPPLPEACNAVHAYQEYDQFPGSKVDKAVSQYKNLVQEAVAASGGRLTCLVADFTQKKAIHPVTKESLNYFYDGVYPNLVLNTDNVRDFVNGFINEINGLGLANNVLGWYLADEPHETAGSSTKPSLQEVEDVCRKAHEAQTAKGWNKPFYIVFYMDGNWAADHNNINFCQWVDPWVNAVTITVGADLVVMIDYYPWLSTAQDFKFSQYPASEAGRSPLRRWWKFIHDTNARYSDNAKVTSVQAVVQAHRIAPTGADPEISHMPSHADMHQQIRAVLNFMQESGSKPGGIWLWGWGRGASGDPTNENLAMVWSRWTEFYTERWAEAVQNEIDNQTECLCTALPANFPADNSAVQVIPTSFKPYNPVTKEEGAWITFRLKDRGKVEFTIKDTSPTPIEKRRLHWEYDYNSVQQKAFNTVKAPPSWPADKGPGQADKLGATAIFFDGKDNCGNNLQGNYTCRLLLNGAPVGCTLSLTVQELG